MPKDLDKDEAAKLERLAKESAAGMLAEIEKDKKNPKKIMSNEEFDDLIKSVPASLGDRRDEPCPFCGEGPQGFCECDDSLDTYKQEKNLQKRKRNQFQIKQLYEEQIFLK